MSSEDSEVKTYLPGDKHGVLLAMIDYNAFFRLLAKIAHSFAVARIGIDGFRHRIPPLLIGKSGDSVDTFPYLVGGDVQDLPTEKSLHVLDDHQVSISGVRFRVVTIRLFAFMRMPRYQIVVGEDLKS
jgi:hypothetical protein